MNIVKLLNGLSLRHLQKRLFHSLNRHFPAILLAVIIGAFLDHFFVKLGVYQFPFRPYPEIFSVNILFTFIGLPFCVFVCLFMMEKVSIIGKAGLLLFLSLLMTVLERVLEICGLFAHSASWKHLYSLGGYIVFFFILAIFDRWVDNKRY